MENGHVASDPSPQPRIGPAVTIGWATSVAMWLVGFFLHLPGLTAAPAVVGIFLLFIHLGAGFACVRLVARESLVRTALIAGLTTGLINLLIVGAIVADPEQRNALQDGAIIAVGGYPIASAVACLVGALFATTVLKLRTSQRAPSTRQQWLALFSMVTVASAIPVLLSGGLVTSHQAGLAVPDWPNSFGSNMFLYPLSKMTGGIYYEHAHRLFGSLVGLTTLALLVYILAAEARTKMKVLGALALVFVIAQGILGGVRVESADEADQPIVMPGGEEQTTIDNAASLGMAMFHGVTAQLYFAYLCALAAMLTPTWLRVERGEHTGESRNDKRLRTFSTVLLASLVLQLLLGSATRHLNHTHVLFTHLGFAFIVMIVGALAGYSALGRHKSEPTLKRLGHGVSHSVMLQVVLGFIAMFLVLPYEEGKHDTTEAIIFATAHQANGALLLGCAAALCAWMWRFRTT